MFPKINLLNRSFELLEIGLKLWIVGFCIFLTYGLLFLLPLKIKIHRKFGRILSNSEILELARNGDVDARKLKKLTNYAFVLIAIFAVLYGLRI